MMATLSLITSNIFFDNLKTRLFSTGVSSLEMIFALCSKQWASQDTVVGVYVAKNLILFVTKQNTHLNVLGSQVLGLTWMIWNPRSQVPF